MSVKGDSFPWNVEWTWRDKKNEITQINLSERLRVKYVEDWQFRSVKTRYQTSSGDNDIIIRVSAHVNIKLNNLPQTQRVVSEVRRI